MAELEHMLKRYEKMTNTEKKRHQDRINEEGKKYKRYAFDFLKDFSDYDNMRIKVLSLLSGEDLLKQVENDLGLSEKKKDIIELIAKDLEKDIAIIFKDKEAEVEAAIYKAEQQLFANNVIPYYTALGLSDNVEVEGVVYENGWWDFKKEIIDCIDYMIKQVKRDISFTPIEIK